MLFTSAESIEEIAGRFTTSLQGYYIWVVSIQPETALILADLHLRRC